MSEVLESQHYTYDDTEEIICNGFEYNLPEETIKLIEDLSKKVGAPTYIKTPKFHSKSNYRKNKNKSLKISDTDWESIRNFKTTEIKKKEGSEIYFDNIKRSLNKITDESYNVVRDEILVVMEEVMQLQDNNELLFSICKVIFETASRNKFYSALYAKLYSELKEKIEMIDEIFTKSYNEFIKTFEVIEYVDADEDYDKFCVVNKNNDDRKAMSLFIIHLIHFNMVSIDTGIQLTEKLIQMFKQNIEKEGTSKIVEEICENLFIIITNADKLIDDLDSNSNWDNIIAFIKEISEKEGDEFPSLSNKVIFKCMDIIEEVV